MATKVTRRSFHRTSTAAAISVAASRAARAADAHERVRLGFIGVANRGGQLIDAFSTHDDVEIIALCDVDSQTLGKACDRLGGTPDTCRDFRQLLDRQDLDAVVIATPDHWHAIQTIMACDAGKDVYVEKPLSMTIHEGRRMVEAARRNRRVVQVGTQRRSSPLYVELARRVAAGDFGKICVARAYRLSNMFPQGIGHAQPKAPPAHLDWNLWLGPRPSRPYQENIAPYNFRWWQLYSSQVANWGVHYLDAIRWCTQELAPSSVCAMGGRFAVDDDRTIPDTLEVTFQFSSGRLVTFGQYETSGHAAFPFGEIELRGTQGTVYAGMRGYQVVPERGGQFQTSEPRMEAEQVDAVDDDSDLSARHARNFLDCVRSRERPNADVEVGHRSTCFSLMANISLALGQRLQWDANAERFVNNEQANQLLHYEYREPWTLP